MFLLTLQHIELSRNNILKYNCSPNHACDTYTLYYIIPFTTCIYMKHMVLNVLTASFLKIVLGQKNDEFCEFNSKDF